MKVTRKELRQDLREIQDQGYTLMGYFGYVKGDTMDKYKHLHEKLAYMDNSPYIFIAEEEKELYGQTWDLHNNFTERLQELVKKNKLKGIKRLKLTQFM